MLSRHYGADSLLLSAGSEDHVLGHVVSALRPLSELPFRLDYDFELKELHEQKHPDVVDAESSAHAQTQSSAASSTASLNSLHSFGSAPTTPSGSTVGKQTKELLQQGSRLLSKLPTQTSLLSWGSSTLGSMFSSSKMKALAGSLSPTGTRPVPELKGINDSAGATSGSEDVFRSAEEPREPSAVIDAYSRMIPAGGATTPGGAATPRAIPVVKDNEILACEYYEDSLEGSTQVGATAAAAAAPASEKLNRIAKQMVGIASPEKKRLDAGGAYKRGVTEYTFDTDIESTVRDMKAKIRAERQNSCSCDSLERSIPACNGSPKRTPLRQCDAGAVEVEVAAVPRMSLDRSDEHFRPEACAAPRERSVPTRPEVRPLVTRGGSCAALRCISAQIVNGCHVDFMMQQEFDDASHGASSVRWDTQCTLWRGRRLVSRRDLFSRPVLYQCFHCQILVDSVSIPDKTRRDFRSPSRTRPTSGGATRRRRAG